MSCAKLLAGKLRKEFAYLKELVELKVRADINGLPLNSEDYKE